MSRKDLEEADLPQGSNPSQNSQIANAVRNQSVVKPTDYPEEIRRNSVAPATQGDAQTAPPVATGGTNVAANRQSHAPTERAELEKMMNNQQNDQQNDRSRQPGENDGRQNGQQDQQRDKSGQQGENRDRNQGGSDNNQRR